MVESKAVKTCANCDQVEAKCDCETHDILWQHPYENCKQGNWTLSQQTRLERTLDRIEDFEIDYDSKFQTCLFPFKESYMCKVTYITGIIRFEYIEANNAKKLEALFKLQKAIDVATQ